MAEHLLSRAGLVLIVAFLILVRAPAYASAHSVHGGAILGGIHVRTPLAAHAPAPDPLRLTVEVSYKGLNHHTGLEIEAVLGQEVEITFVWADDAVPDNAHRLLLKGYELETELLTSENREQTLRFVADRTGTFELVCDWRCEGHSTALQSARLTVTDPHVAEPLARLPTSLLLAPIASAAESPVTLRATLRGGDGEPVVGVPVGFYLRTTFAGVEGEAEVAAVLTDDRGDARATYTPTRAGEHVFVIRFAGSDLLAESQELVRVAVERPTEPYQVAPRGLEALSDVTPLVVAAVVATIWLTFGYVLFQVVRIRRPGGRSRRSVTGATPVSSPRKEGPE